MLENVYEGLNARKCNGRSNQKVQKTKSIYFLILLLGVPKCIFPKCIYPKCISAKCTRIACLLSFTSLFYLATDGAASVNVSFQVLANK